MSYAEKPDEITKDEWMEKLNNLHVQRADMNRLIMNYLVTEGFKEAAEKFRMESGIEPSVDLETLDERIKIREMILKGQIQEAIALINSLHPELLDTNRYLYFHLQQQHLIELIRQRETEAALEFAQTQLAEQGEESRECLTEMERTLALLAFDSPEESPFGDLLHMMQRQKVWSEVNQAVLDYENRESTPKLAKLLKLLLWAQNELDQKKVKYPKMTDLSKGTAPLPRAEGLIEKSTCLGNGPHDSKSNAEGWDGVGDAHICRALSQPSMDMDGGVDMGNIFWPECQAWTGMLLLGTCLLYCARVTMPVCTVAMSQDFGWNKKEAGIVLSSFFWGYCLTQVVGGHLGDRIGGEKVILLSASTWGFITVVTPLLAHLGSGHLAFVTFSRILTGLLQGVYFPALTSLLSQRVQESERAFTYSTVSAGSQFGTLVTGGVGSVLLDWCGWQSVFYFSGGLTLLWVYYVYRYLLNEKDLVLALGVLAQGLPMARPSKVPWRQLFRKPSVWAAICSQLSSACSFFILLSWLPTFFKENFPHSKGWVFNVVPWLLAIPASLFSGFLSDRLISRGYRVITVRKFMQVMGLGLSSVFALCLGHTTSFLKAIIFASASIGFQTFNHSGISVNIQDLAPSCAGFLFGVANTAGALAGVIGVCLGGYLIEATGSWTCVFHLVAIISNLGLGTFLVFGKAQRVDLTPTHEDL
ncbi:hypothetical protein STEG23_030791 [Scotinomys teguina]